MFYIPLRFGNFDNQFIYTRQGATRSTKKVKNSTEILTKVEYDKLYEKVAYKRTEVNRLEGNSRKEI